MAYRHRKEIQDKFNMERSSIIVTKNIKPKKVYSYNLTSSTQKDFDDLVKTNNSKKHRAQLNPLTRSLGQLTPSNVFNVRGSDIQNLRLRLYKGAKILNISIETSFSPDKQALLVRLKRNWPVGVDINIKA